MAKHQIQVVTRKYDNSTAPTPEEGVYGILAMLDGRPIAFQSYTRDAVKEEVEGVPDMWDGVTEIQLRDIIMAVTGLMYLRLEELAAGPYDAEALDRMTQLKHALEILPKTRPFEYPCCRVEKLNHSEADKLEHEEYNRGSREWLADFQNGQFLRGATVCLTEVGANEYELTALTPF